MWGRGVIGGGVAEAVGWQKWHREEIQGEAGSQDCRRPGEEAGERLQDGCHKWGNDWGLGQATGASQVRKPKSGVTDHTGAGWP